MRIVALIPARSGSKGIYRKNVKLFNGKPLIVHSIEQALECPQISKVIVSTDDEQIKSISLAAGADVPFLRPKDISQDLSTDIEWIKHYLLWQEKYDFASFPDIIVHLRPTYPKRDVSFISNCIKLFCENSEIYDSLRTVVKCEKSPFKTYIKKNDLLIPLFQSLPGITEPYNQCRQSLPITYIHNGCLDIVSTKTIQIQNSITGKRIFPVIMDEHENIDIDTEQDWQNALDKLI